MHTIPLSPQLKTEPRQFERSDEAAIVGEIARHLLEYKETTSKQKCQHLIQKLATLATLDTQMLWLVLSLLSGDLSEITRSYSDIGRAEGKSKQAVQQELERYLAKIRRHYPELEEAIVALRQISANYLEKESNQ